MPVITPAATRAGSLRDTVKLKPFDVGKLALPFPGGDAAVIEIVPGQIITRKRFEKAPVRNGAVFADTERDILKLAVLERHKATGNIGLGLVKGFGLKRGALASSIAHDSHNIVAVGASDEDIYVAVREIERTQGGLAVAAGGRVLDSLPLPVAGLLADQPVAAVAAGLEKLNKLCRDMGCGLAAPFATLSFLALPVIPELRLTDMGLVDVNKFRLVSLRGD